MPPQAFNSLRLRLAEEPADSCKLGVFREPVGDPVEPQYTVLFTFIASFLTTFHLGVVQFEEHHPQKRDSGLEGSFAFTPASTTLRGAVFLSLGAVWDTEKT